MMVHFEDEFPLRVHLKRFNIYLTLLFIIHCKSWNWKNVAAPELELGARTYTECFEKDMRTNKDDV